MKKLDVYIFKKLIVTYVFTVLLLVGVLLVIDLAEKAEDFARPDLTAWKILTQYYLNFIPHFANMLSPLMIFIATVFVTSKLATHTEIVAMLSSGMSLRRILYPYFLGSIVIGIFVFFLINWIVPNSNKVRHRFEDTYVRDRFYFNERNVHIKIAPSIYVYLESYDNVSHTGFRFTMEKIEGQKLLSKLESPRINWNEEKEKWSISTYKLRNFTDKGEEIEQGNQMDTILNMHPKDFESKHLYQERLTLTELNAYIAELKLRGADDVEVYVVEKYERLAYPFAIIILTMMGVVVAARKSRGGTGFKMAFGFVLAFLYILLIVISRSFAQKGGIPPQLSAWIPNTLFFLIGLYMYRQVPK